MWFSAFRNVRSGIDTIINRDFTSVNVPELGGPGCIVFFTCKKQNKRYKKNTNVRFTSVIKIEMYKSADKVLYI